MRREAAAVLALGSLAVIAMGGHAGPDFVPLDKALAAARDSLKGIAVYAVVDPGGGGGSTIQADRAMQSCTTLAGWDEWIWVHCGDLKTATRVKSGGVPQIIFFDCDFERLNAAGVSDINSIQAAIQGACDKYSAREIAWQDYEAEMFEAEEGKPAAGGLTVLAFTSERDDSKELLQALTHKSMAKYHGKFAWVKHELIKDSEESRRWKIVGTPTLVVVDPSREPGKQVIDRCSGLQGLKSLRKLLAGAIDKAKASKKKSP